MRGRPGLVRRVLASSAADWFGRPLRQVHDADMLRWEACVLGAQAVLNGA